MPLGTEEYTVDEDIRKRLILAGIKELNEHGMAAFSYRRVAIAAGVSCAAPYRHFKSKDDFICAMMQYINAQWDLIATQIRQIFAQDEKRCIAETVKSVIRFFAANSNYRAVMFAGLSDDDEQRNHEKRHMADTVFTMVKAYAERIALPLADKRAFGASAALYGALLVTDDHHPIDKTLDALLQTVALLLQA